MPFPSTITGAHVAPSTGKARWSLPLARAVRAGLLVNICKATHLALPVCGAGNGAIGAAQRRTGPRCERPIATRPDECDFQLGGREWQSVTERTSAFFQHCARIACGSRCGVRCRTSVSIESAVHHSTDSIRAPLRRGAAPQAARGLLAGILIRSFLILFQFQIEILI